MKTIKKKTMIIVCLVLCISLLLPMQIDALFDRYGVLKYSDVIVDRVYSIKSFMDGRRIDVVNALTGDGSNVWTYPYNGAACQEWQIVRAPDAADEYMIKDMNSGSYLSIVASSSAEGANAWIWHNDGTAGQRFHIVNYVGVYYKFLTKSSGYTKALAVDYNTHNLYQTDSSSAYTTFYLEDASALHGIPAGKGYLQSKNTERFLNNVSGLFINKICQSNIDSSIIGNPLDFVYMGGGYYRINVSNSRCLTVKNNNVGQGLGAAAYTGVSGQLWKATSRNGGVELQPKLDLTYYLSIDGNNNVHNGELKLATSSSDNTLWLAFSTEEIADKNDLTFISFSDDQHTGCARHLDQIDKAMKSFAQRLSTTKGVYIGYNDNTSMDWVDFSKEAGNTRFLLVRAHGNANANGPYIILNSRKLNGNYYGTASYFHYDELPNMENCECAFFLSCHSGEGTINNVNAENFLQYAVDECGVSYAIGFEGAVSCDYAERMLESFLAAISNGESVYSAFNSSKSVVIEREENGRTIQIRLEGIAYLYTTNHIYIFDNFNDQPTTIYR